MVFLHDKSKELIAHSLELRQSRLEESKRKEMVEWERQHRMHAETIVRLQREHALKKKRAEEELQRMLHGTQSLWTACHSLEKELGCVGLFGSMYSLTSEIIKTK